MKLSSLASSGVIVLIGCTLACNRAVPLPRAEASASSAAVSSSTAPVSGAGTTQPWFAGNWSGDYSAQAMEPVTQAPEAAQKQWHTASASTPSNGVLSFRVAPDGDVQGESTGDLGRARLVGHAEADSIKLRFEASESKGGYAGTLVLRRENGAFCVGTLRVSTGDSLAIRQASVNLKRHE